MNGVGVAVAAFTAVAIEVAEAALVVLVAAGRGHRRAAWTAAAVAAVLVAGAAIAAGPRVLALVPIDLLRQLVGGALLLLGLFWMIRSTVAPDAAAAELNDEMRTARRWALRGPVGAALISAKAVLVEGAEAAALVVAIGSPQHALGAALAGAAAAVLAVAVVARAAQQRLERITAPQLDRLAGTVLSLIGAYWLADGAHLGPLAIAGLLGLALAAVAATWIRATAHPRVSTQTSAAPTAPLAAVTRHPELASARRTAQSDAHPGARPRPGAAR